MSSPIDFSHYNPPGVYTYAFPGPQLAVNSTLPTAVGLIGQAIGYMNFTQTVQINPDVNDTTPSPTQTLANAGINTSTLTVVNPNSLAPYTLNTDYTVVLVGGSAGTATSLYAIERVISGHIAPGDYIQVSYQYTNASYYTPYIFYSYQDMVTAYGAPYNLATGTIQSGITLMGQFAFLNGAYQVVACAVESSNGPGNATVGDYTNTLAQLADNALVAIVVTDSGAQPLHQFVQEHVDQQSANRFERRGIVGLDGTVTAVASSQRIIDAQSITDSRIMLVCPATFTYYSPELSTSVTVGGQYMTACLAAMTIALGFEMPLTRKTITGWTAVAETEPSGQKNLESQNGLCVIEQTRTQQIQVRHGVSTNPASLLTREWSVTGAQDAMVYELRDYLESDNLIGQPIYPYTLINVKGSAEAALQQLVVNGIIVDYTGLTCRQLITNPDVLEVSFQWLPPFPLNYIVCTFAVTLSTGSTSVSSGSTTNQSNVSSATQVGSSSTITTPDSTVVNDFGGASNTLQSD
jgi:hypothetical protein